MNVWFYIFSNYLAFSWSTIILCYNFDLNALSCVNILMADSRLGKWDKLDVTSSNLMIKKMLINEIPIVRL